VNDRPTSHDVKMV